MYTLADLRAFGRKRGWCPYFLARHMMAFANVVVFNYQYMIDPKVGSNSTARARSLVCRCACSAAAPCSAVATCSAAACSATAAPASTACLQWVR